MVLIISGNTELDWKVIWKNASERGWCAIGGDVPIGGRWSFLEKNHTIVVELKS